MSTTIHNKNQQLVHAAIINNPGISATSSIILEKIEGFKVMYRKPSDDVAQILRKLKDQNLIEETKGRLYPL